LRIITAVYVQKVR